MTNYEMYKSIFSHALGIDDSALLGLEYQQVESWDSVGHMNLIFNIEDAFGIEMSMDDIIDFNSFERGMKILERYGVFMDRA